jgi:hypothetical protein
MFYGYNKTPFESFSSREEQFNEAAAELRALDKSRTKACALLRESVKEMRAEAKGIQHPGSRHSAATSLRLARRDLRRFCR